MIVVRRNCPEQESFAVVDRFSLCLLNNSRHIEQLKYSSLNVVCNVWKVWQTFSPTWHKIWCKCVVLLTFPSRENHEIAKHEKFCSLKQLLFCFRTSYQLSKKKSCTWKELLWKRLLTKCFSDVPLVCYSKCQGSFWLNFVRFYGQNRKPKTNTLHS